MKSFIIAFSVFFINVASLCADDFNTETSTLGFPILNKDQSIPNRRLPSISPVIGMYYNNSLELSFRQNLGSCTCIVTNTESNEEWITEIDNTEESMTITISNGVGIYNVILYTGNGVYCSSFSIN